MRRDARPYDSSDGSEVRTTSAGAALDRSGRAFRLNLKRDSALLSPSLRPAPPRPVSLTGGILKWTEPRITDNVTHYLIYRPDGTLFRKVPVGNNQTVDYDAQQAFLTSFDARTGQESTQAHVNAGGPAITFEIRREMYALLTIRQIAVPEPDYVRFINFAAWAIDETDIGLRGSGTIDADDLTFTPTLTEESRLGTTFDDGDYFVWIDAGADNLTPNYEICRKVSEAGGVWTIERGKLGSSVGAHTSKLFLRLRRYHMTPAQRKEMSGTEGTPNGLPVEWEFPHPNKCVCAMTGQGVGISGLGTVYTLNVAPTQEEVDDAEPGGDDPDPQFFPIAPGLRVMNGAAYPLTVGGTLSAGLTADFEHMFDAPEQIRNVHAYLDETLAVGETNGKAVVVYVIYINPARTIAALIDTLFFDEDARRSCPADELPTFARQMPRHEQNASFISWPVSKGHYPPHLLYRLTNALDADGFLQSGFTLDTVSAPIVAEEAGWIGLWVQQVGSTDAGAGLVVRMQT